MNMVKRYTWCNAPEGHHEVVLAKDYDILAAELAALKERHEFKSNLTDRIRELEAALRDMVEAAEIGKVFTSGSRINPVLLRARAALTAPETNCTCAAPVGMPHLDTCRSKYLALETPEEQCSVCPECKTILGFHQPECSRWKAETDAQQYRDQCGG